MFLQKKRIWSCLIKRKHPTRQFYKISVLGVMFSWKIVCVVTIIIFFLSPKWESESITIQETIIYHLTEQRAQKRIKKEQCKRIISMKWTFYFWHISIRKHPTRQFCKISVLGGMVSYRKSYLFLKIFEKAFLENLICSYGISFFWKILCVLTKFWTRSPGKFDLFLLYFFLLENRMCSSTFCLFWKIHCVLITSKPSGKFDVF